MPSAQGKTKRSIVGGRHLDVTKLGTHCIKEIAKGQSWAPVRTANALATISSHKQSIQKCEQIGA